MVGYLQLLRRNPDYTRLWIAQAISLLGDWFSTIALSTIVVKYSGGSGIAVSGLLLARFIPPLIVGPFAGVLVDRFNRKWLMIISDILRTVIVLLFLLVNDPSHLWLVYVLTLIQFSLGAMFEPARSAIIPSVVQPDDLVKANLLGSVTWSVMLAAGAAIGGVVSSLFGTPIALMIDAASFAFSAAFVSSIKPKIINPASNHPSHTHMETQLGFRDGLRYIAKRPTTAATLLIKLGGSVGTLDTFMVIYATQLFVIGEGGTGSLGVFYATFGLGAILGPILLNRFNNGSIKTMRRLVSAAYACIALGWFLFGGAPGLILAAAGILVKAMGSSIYWTYSSVILQKTVPDRFLGRLFALDLAGFQLATVISVVITGWAVEKVQVRDVQSLVIATGIASLIPLIGWTLAIPWIEKKALIERQLDSSEVVPSATPIQT